MYRTATVERAADRQALFLEYGCKMSQVVRKSTAVERDPAQFLRATGARTTQYISPPNAETYLSIAADRETPDSCGLRQLPRCLASAMLGMFLRCRIIGGGAERNRSHWWHAHSISGCLIATSPHRLIDACPLPSSSDLELDSSDALIRQFVRDCCHALPDPDTMHYYNVSHILSYHKRYLKPKSGRAESASYSIRYP